MAGFYQHAENYVHYLKKKYIYNETNHYMHHIYTSLNAVVEDIHQGGKRIPVFRTCAINNASYVLQFW